MRPDFVFISSGFAAVLAAVGVAIYALRAKQRRQWWPVLFWCLLAGGLLLQGFSPHLQIKQHSFVILVSPSTNGQPLDPAALVDRDRIMQAASGIVLIIACIGLAFQYRQYFLKPSPATGDRRPLR
ncbi:MAG TPA: hypothetical protein VFW40_04035 [Capsulimonadaceae bacterium]|nr:hypothetical protein [Capsulimonadaceae bacterium]